MVISNCLGSLVALQESKR